ncbi:MAG: BamA/TamA family outer membrane protein [Acidobacteriota bacterium]|nr:BamA/TamA family outer membrane protein [Acidobacteriota bacterium]
MRLRHRRATVRTAALAALVMLGAAALAPAAYGQYFGHNKVQYEKFAYQVLKTEHFDIYYYTGEEKAIRVAGQIAERWYRRYERLLDYTLRGRQPLIMYANHPQFEQTTALNELMSEGTGGVTESLKRRIILPFGGTLEDTDHVIGHELVHAFQYDIAAGPGPKYAMQGGGGLEQAPLWMIEGAAEYLSIGPVDTQTAMWMRDLLNRKDFPTIKDLFNPYNFFPYRYGQAVWAYIGGKYGDMAVAKLMKDVIRGADYEKAIEKNLGVTIKKLGEDWHAALKKDYAPLAKETRKPTDLGKLLLQGSLDDPYNIAPALSPDGKRFLFISSRDLFSIDMYLGDAKTGKVMRKITSTAVDPHFQSIQFINSAGSWNARGDRFVFGAINASKPVLAFLDADGRRVDKEIRFPELGEILNPTWSPDGRQIAFSALNGGASDLHLYDLETKTLKSLTSDIYGDLHPAWSPDGRWIAFVTERFNTDLAILNVGPTRLALLDPATGEIKPLGGFLQGQAINPQWSSDSRSVFFVADRDGISNVYRIDIATGEQFQVTNLYTGASGITSLSPTLSVASKSNDVLYSVYQDGNYSLYSIDPGHLAGTPVRDLEALATAAVLPPQERPGSEILGLLRNPLFGLPDAGTFTSQPYQAKIGLDYISPPTIGMSVGRYGTYAGGGMAFLFSDMLGYHTIVAQAQISNRIIDSAFQVAYYNTTNRLNFGLVAQRIPYQYGSYGYAYDYVDGELAYIDQELIYRQIYYDLGAFASYPMSSFQRFELNGGLRYVDFANTYYEYAYSYTDGFLLSREEYDLDSPAGIFIPYVGAALVYDSSLFGATAPVLGQSYRLEVTPSFGTLNYVTLLADYRKYVVPIKPFTLAGRVVYYGRFGSGATDGRLWPMYLGYETTVRGYNYTSFDADEDFDFNRMFGNAMLLANFELRFPLFGLLGIGRGYYGIFPLDVVAFYDAGMAWYTDATEAAYKPFFQKGGELKPLRSIGIGLRANLFGFLVLGVNYVNPIDRPDKKPYIQVTFYPGF